MNRTAAVAAVVLVLVAACGSTGVEPVEVSGPIVEPAQQRQVVDDIFTTLDEQGFTGLVMVRNGNYVVVRGFGIADREAEAPWSEDTVFDIGSITKQFTGAAIVRMEMDGLLSVTDTVGDHIPYATGELADVTLHELLTHTAGLPHDLGDDYDPIGRKEIVELSARTIGARGAHKYTNTGYSILGAVIEEVTGMSYEEYLRSVFFAPLGMASTGYVLPDWSAEVVAVGYDRSRTWGRPNDQRWDDDGPYWHLRANGGMLSTGTDMMRWHEALLGDEVLNDAAKAKLFARHAPEGPADGAWYYGYGWVNVELGPGRTLITHNGGNDVFFADFLRFVDDDLTIIVATNTAGADDGVAYRISDALLGTTLASD